MGKYRIRKTGERAFVTLLAAVVLVFGCGIAAMAESQSKDGVTMYYYLTQSGNTWTARRFMIGQQFREAAYHGYMRGLALITVPKPMEEASMLCFG